VNGTHIVVDWKEQDENGVTKPREVSLPNYVQKIEDSATESTIAEVLNVTSQDLSAQNETSQTIQNYDNQTKSVSSDTQEHDNQTNAFKSSSPIVSGNSTNFANFTNYTASLPTPQITIPELRSTLKTAWPDNSSYSIANNYANTHPNQQLDNTSTEQSLENKYESDSYNTVNLANVTSPSLIVTELNPSKTATQDIEGLNDVDDDDSAADAAGIITGAPQELDKTSSQVKPTQPRLDKFGSKNKIENLVVSMPPKQSEPKSEHEAIGMQGTNGVKKDEGEVLEMKSSTEDQALKGQNLQYQRQNQGRQHELNDFNTQVQDHEQQTPHQNSQPRKALSDQAEKVQKNAEIKLDQEMKERHLELKEREGQQLQQQQLQQQQLQHQQLQQQQQIEIQEKITKALAERNLEIEARNHVLNLIRDSNEAYKIAEGLIEQAKIANQAAEAAIGDYNSHRTEQQQLQQQQQQQQQQQEEQKDEMSLPPEIISLVNEAKIMQKKAQGATDNYNDLRKAADLAVNEFNVRFH
jgi:hypothetical protein